MTRMDTLGTAAELAELGQQLRVDAVRMSSAANSGHPTSSMSAADLMAVLLAKYLRFDFDAPEDPGNDHLIFSKGHASPIARFDQVEGVSDAERDQAWERIKSAARRYDVDVSEGSWRDLAKGGKDRKS